MPETEFSVPSNSRLMNSKYLKVSLIAGLVLAVVFAFIRWQIAVGILLGLGFYQLYFFLLTLHINEVISEAAANGKILTIWPKMVRLFVLFFPFLVAYLLPEYVSFIGVTIGLLMFKFCMFVMTFIER